MTENHHFPHEENNYMDDPGPLDDVVDEDTDDLKLDLDTPVWLVKVPKFLADRWNANDKDDVQLGTVRIYSQSPQDQPNKISLILPERDIDDKSPEIPNEYSISVLQDINKYVFTEDENGRRSVSGRVHNNCIAEPAMTAQYREIIRERRLAEQKHKRTAQTILINEQPVFAPGASSNMSSTDFSDFISPKRSKTDREKATRMPRNELMDIIFNAFERYPYYSLKAMMESTKQPQQYLKEILGDICVMNKKGPYTGQYQLKAEYVEHRPAAGTPQVDNEDGLDDDDDDDDLDEEGMETIL